MRDSESKRNKFVLVLSMALASLLFTGPSSSAERTIQTPLVVGAGEDNSGELAGVVNRVSEDGRAVVIDDQLVELAAVVRFNGASWSRERLVKELDEGLKIYFEVDPEAKGRTLRIISIRSRD
ncbi:MULTISPECIES: hypothetical protein [Marinobacter]|jgi:hypothetical protein|uniref:Uncharacterized protein n=1 Tax=Marinobacter salsuginis TaxID=418719 RepID=A0A5M3PXJ0_9GAMM|nr:MULTISPECIES: hypothetical protein [Marinobacter]PTB82339.1 hypothetical protein C9984_00330 [Marinobacter sp. Z-D5-3]PTB98120.1 hypothetical protein C9993_08860 [Marinobacter sp. Z-F4-2]MBW3228481.1 hypothetical protein [Marinobacter adhaerens]SFE71493.1 hypothetical protein SAMN04487869_11493 [Marinobacter sp. DSM 26671]GBO87551.1 hypothetical protein MSSD14B_12190 [Marinobacter salsuginis]